ncbi:Hypothetical predicted protein [Mytilus galloprovincialis]|uniref:C2H2-type domain-containing protein n=1 Tax=Mytilus galloprovincialis TaxID=29158 RepID=A0A8B6GQ54_MYTGA|nr:Hypothetical predicted protein [Mytilus galloprovincialis]
MSCIKILTTTGLVVPIGAPICTNCRKELSVKPVETICHESYAEGATSCIAEEKRERHTIVEVNCFSDADSESQPIFSQDSEASVCGIGKLEKLNAYLEITNVSPIKEKTTPLSTSCEKTRKKCVSKALECLTAICSTICPGEGEELETMVLQAKQTLLNEKITTLDQTSFILKEVYLQAESWTLQRQILSIICKDRTFGEIKELLPNVSAWKFNKAKHHTNDVGCGMPVALDKKCRNRVDNEKLEHFIDYILSSNIIKDLPYGTKTMKLSSGEVVEVPNLIRSLAPSSLITQYTQYCEAEDIKPLGSSTLYKILNDCSASVRKCIEGLDYYVAEGGRSFLDLENIIEKLEITDERKKEMISCLLSGKSYLKSDFKVHIEAESNIADHCRLFALSEGEEQCGHSHTEICLQCRNLDEILNEISTIVQSVNWENKDAVLFQVESAVDSITDWKAHIMRSRNQEDARLDLVRDLKNGQVLVTCDWAMKMLPRKYREGQTDWFAKRGMNWHIAVSVFKEQGCIKNFTHVHIFSAQISQDSPITSSLIKDTVADLHTLIPDIQEIHIYSDNAGCYKNTLMMASLRRDVGNKIKSYNFSEAQDGKGPCYRRASHIKSVIKRYINEGHDVTSAEEMKVAIDARQNGQFRVKVVDTVTVIDGEKNNTKSIAGITQLHNFPDNFIPWKSLGSPPKPAELLIKLNWTNEETVSRSLSTEDEDLHPKPKRRKISYDCPKDGCIKSFSSNETLDNHLLLGDCNYVQVISVHDKAKIMYGTKVNSLFINTHSVSIPSDSVVGESGLRQGWALKTKKKRVIFSEAQRKYMHDRFYAGKRTGSKVDPFRAAEEMRNMKEEDQYLFKRNDYLTGQQISSYFSRLAMKDRNSEPGDFKSAEEEDSKHELKIKILQQISK